LLMSRANRAPSELRASAIARRRTEEERDEAVFSASDDDGGGFRARCASSS
jgi:hypothetical protein